MAKPKSEKLLKNIMISVPKEFVQCLDQRLINRSAMVTMLFEKYLQKEIELLYSPNAKKEDVELAHCEKLIEPEEK